MRRLTVDLRSRWLPPRWAWGLVGLLFVVGTGLGVAAHWQSQKLKALKAERDRLLNERVVPPPPTEPIRKMPYDASAREMLALAQSDWPAMLTAIESVEVSGVLPTSIELVPAEHLIRVELQFSDYAKLLEYIDALNREGSRAKWHLVQAQLGNHTAAALAWSATVVGTW